MKKYKTKALEGSALQYNGDNLEELQAAFPCLSFEILRSKTSWNGNVYTDLCVSDGTRSLDLIAGDWIMSNTGEHVVIPLDEFEEYWEEV